MPWGYGGLSLLFFSNCSMAYDLVAANKPAGPHHRHTPTQCRRASRLRHSLLDTESRLCRCTCEPRLLVEVRPGTFVDDTLDIQLATSPNPEFRNELDNPIIRCIAGLFKHRRACSLRPSGARSYRRAYQHGFIPEYGQRENAMMLVSTRKVQRAHIRR